jgi:hypothetical protein
METFRQLITSNKLNLKINESFNSAEIWREAQRGNDSAPIVDVIAAAESLKNINKIKSKIEDMFDDVIISLIEGFIYVYCKTTDLENVDKDAKTVNNIMKKAIVKYYDIDGPDIWDESDGYRVIQIGYELLKDL